MNYTLISGFYRYSTAADWFFALWLNSVASQPIKPDKIIAIAVDHTQQMRTVTHDRFQLISLTGNLGHVHQLIGKQEPEKPHAFCGWSASILAGALLAYSNETDVVFCEQDVLMFGDCIGAMYRELGDGKMIFGRKMQSAPWMPCAQSLFLIKHDWIPQFVASYLSYGNDRDQNNLPEHKFMKLLQRHKHAVRQFSFGYDRERPLDMTLPVWYSQKMSGEELLEMRERGLISFEGQPPAGLFTSQA